MKKSLILLFLLIALLTLTTSIVYAYPERMPLPPQIVFCRDPQVGCIQVF